METQDPVAPVTRLEFAALVEKLDQFMGAYQPHQQPSASAPHDDRMQQSGNGDRVTEPRASEEEVHQDIPDPRAAQPPPHPVQQPQYPHRLVVQEIVMGPLERAQRLGITHFEGTTDPAVALSWLDSVEGIYTYLHLTDPEKTETTAFLLRGPALFWWKVIKGRYPGPAPITWLTFVTEFKKKYVSATHIEDRQREFLDLQQKGHDH